jgi:hypothetical protein
MDAKEWANLFKVTSIVCACVGAFIGGVSALSGLGYYFADRSVQWGRRLSQSQIDGLRDALKVLPKPLGPISMSAATGDAEAQDVGKGIKLAFEAAGLKVDGVWPDHIIGSDPYGILVRQNLATDSPGLGIAAALKSVGLATQIIALNRDPGKVDIVVGHKP